MTEILKSLFLTSCVGTVLGLLLMLIRPVTKKVFSASWHYYMWVIVLLVMILPVSFSLPEPTLDKPVYQEEPKVVFQSETENEPAVEWIEPEAQVVYTQLEESPERKDTVLKKINEPFVFGMWMLGVLGLFLFRLVSYGIFLIKLRRKSESVNCPEVALHTKRMVRVRVSDYICSPLLIGIFRPILLLPKAELSTEQLRYILAHECVHLKRQDVVYKWFLSMVKCIHWFNPAIYLIARQVNLDCEISCDMTVVKNMDSGETGAYVETILALLSRSNSRQIPLTTGMTGKKKALKQRFLMLKQKRKISKKMVVFSVVLALLLAIGAVVTSGILNGRVELPNEELVGLNVDERQGDDVTILVEGVDQAGRADAILAFHFDGKTLTCMNIPRNTEYICAEDSSIYTLADYLAKNQQPQAAVDAVRELFAFPIHYYARVEMEAVEKMVDAMGGIEFDVPYNMVYDDPYQDLHINLTEGNQRLSGEQVMHLLRFRDRSAENDQELRRMMWESVMDAVLNQGVFGNRLPDITELYQMVTEQIETNYPLEELARDLKKLQNCTRNNVVFGTVRGRNLVADGRFVFRINHVASAPLLQVFQAETTAEKLISTISYTNEVMGFSLKLPEYWKSGYDAVQYHNQVVFYHKEIFEKYGKGSGMLFSITKLDRSQGETMEELAEPSECLYWSKDVAYYWNIATDVQYPAWADRDEEDEVLAEDYETMMMDINFIKNSFTFLENSEEDKNLKTKATAHAGKTATTTKEATVSKESYTGFEQLVVKNTNPEQIQKELHNQGFSKVTGNSADLNYQYIQGEYSYQDSLSYKNHNITCDENGNISLYVSVNQDNLVAVNFYDAETKENVGQYGILANNENAYTFLGFDPNKVYDIEIQGETLDGWKVEGEFLIY